LFITSQKPITDGALITDDAMLDLGIPRNYHNPLIYNLALELAPENGIEPSMLVVARAQGGKDKIRSLNAANSVSAIGLDFANSRCINNDLVRYN